MDQHVVVVGYGTKGRSAIETLAQQRPVEGQDRRRRPGPGRRPGGQQRRADRGRRRRHPARRAAPRRASANASQIIITTDRDDSTVLSVLNARQLNAARLRRRRGPGGRERLAGPAERRGRRRHVLGRGRPAAGAVVGQPRPRARSSRTCSPTATGLEVAERELLVPEVGKQPQQLPDQVIAVVRDNKVHRYFEPVVTQLAQGRPADRRTPGAGAALGAAARDPRRGHRRGSVSRRVGLSAAAAGSGSRSLRSRAAASRRSRAGC